MKHPLVAAILVSLSLVALTQAVEESTPGQPERRAIREFPVDVLSRLGREMYRHDQLAWVATDLLMKTVSREQLAKDGAAGWVVDAKDQGAALVRFLRKKGGTLEASYDVSFPEQGEPKLRLHGPMAGHLKWRATSSGGICNRELIPLQTQRDGENKLCFDESC